MTRPTFVLTSGPEGFVDALDKDRLRLDSNAPVPPGSRVEGMIAEAVSIRGKVIGASRGGAPGRFVVMIKLADVSRGERERLTALLGAAG
jgi:hypothetical protein